MKKILLAGFFVVLLVGLPITAFLLQKPQELRSRATAATVLSFSPVSSPSNPIAKKVGDTIPLDIMINPGTNAISTLKLQLHFDPGKFQGVGTSPFVPSSTSFPTIVEGPVYNSNSGDFVVTISVGSDPTKAIRTTTKVGTLTLTAANPTDATASIVSFGSSTQALSVASTDQASENVLATATPAYITISAIPTPTLIPTHTPTPLPTDTPTPTPILTPSPTLFSFTVFLHGIGDSGDNANPTSNSLSNKNPQHQAHTITVSVYNTTNQLVINKLGTITYNPDDGDYTGVVPMGTTLTTGDYTIKIKADSYLQKRIPAIVHIVPATTMNMPTVSLIAGETTGDNVISILDYNMLLGCYSDLLPPTFCDANKQVLTDLNDDGNVNQIDYNLFLREITVQNGD